MIVLRGTAIVLLAGLPLLLLAAEDKPTEPKPDTFGLTIDAHAALQLKAAAAYVNDEDWTSAVRQLQHLLDGPPDALADIGGRYVNIQGEAERLLAALPEKGREAYGQANGTRAAELLRQARQTGDAELLARIERRYLYTDSGPGALRELARQHYKAGRMLPAARYYARLLDHLSPARWITDDLYQATLALVKYGTPSDAGTVRKQLLARAQPDGIRLGDRKLSMEELQKATEPKSSPRRADDWLMFGGDATRSARGSGGPPFLSPKWRKSMLHTNDDKTNLTPPARHLNDALKHWSKERNQPVIPAFAPITITVTRGEKKTPQLIYKNYWGIVARDLKSGEIIWASPSNWSLEQMLRPHAPQRQQQAMNTWLQYYIAQHQQPQILWENSTVGTLSTDGQFVYAVEDLSVPPTPAPNVNMGFPGGVNNAVYGNEIQDAIAHSRLQAFKLDIGGKLTWELGGEDKRPMADCYFLGSPMPLDGLLYLLVDKQQELELVCLDPNAIEPMNGVPRPVVLSTLTLGKFPESMRNDVRRRITAAPLAYEDGILVCPSNAGILFGVDLRANRLAWAYPYRDKSDLPRPVPNRRGRVIGPGQPPSNPNRWKASAPILAGGKIVFTPPDASSIHCLNLRDGARLWSRKKKDDEVYLAGVFDKKVLIVGKSRMAAFNLADGKAIWMADTGMPSGRGVAAGDTYYLPLKEATDTKKPEIQAIDLRTGRVVSHSRPRKEGVGEIDVPGNLLFAGGDLLAVSAEEVAVYPSLTAAIKRADEGMNEKADGAVVRLMRAELRRGNGDLAGAIDELRSALKSNVDDNTRRRARALLFDSLTESFQRDPRAAERSLKEYEELCTVDRKGATGEETARRRSEETQRRRRFNLLLARLREGQGRMKEALSAYFDLLTEGPADEMIAPPGERGLMVRRDLWVRGLIGELLKRATAEQRKQLEAMIRDRLKAAKALNDVDELRQLAALFGAATETGGEARLQLAERLTQLRDLLEAELRLLEVHRHSEDAVRSARALEMLGRVMLARGLPADAVHYYRLLQGEHRATVLPDGRTGAKVWEEIASDKRLLPFLDPADAFDGKLKARKQEGDFPSTVSVFPFEHDGEDLPFFRRVGLGFGFNDNTLRLLDRNTGAGSWSHAVSGSSFAGLVAPGRTPSPRLRYHTRGHLVVVATDRAVLGLDPTARRVLWEKDILTGDKKADSPQWSLIQPDLPGDGLRISYPDGWVHYLGQNMVLSRSVLCLTTRQGLQAFDPLTGRLVWTRPDLIGRIRIFGDEEHVFVIEDDSEERPASTRIYHLADGGSVSAPDFAAAFARRRQMFGRFLLLSETNEKGVNLRLHDVLTARAVWETSYPPKSILLHGEAPYMTGTVEPDGKVHIIDLRQRKEVMTGQMVDPADHLRGVQTIRLLSDRARFYVACDTGTNGDGNRGDIRRVGNIEVESNLMPESGLRDVSVNGVLYAFERGSGAVAWYVQARRQRLLIDPFGDLPVVFLTAHRKRVGNLPFGGARFPEGTAVQSIEKRSGRVLVSDDALKCDSPFYAVRRDPASGTITFVSPKMKIVHYTQDGKAPAKK